MKGKARGRGPAWLHAAAPLVLLSVTAPVRGAEAAPLSVEAKIPLGDIHGRIDHLAIDLKRHRLYVAELGNDTVGVVDLEAGKTVQTVPGLKEPQGIGYDAGTDTLYVANARDGSVHLFKGGDLGRLGTIELGDDADNVRIEEGAHRVWVGYGSGALAVIDANRRRKIADIPLKGHPESFRLASTGSSIFVNVPDAGEIVIVDRSANRAVASWKTHELRSNYPLALDDAGRILTVFRHPARLAVFSQDGRRLQALQTCGDSDDVFADARRHRVYVTCGEGLIDVFSLEANGYQHTGKLTTISGARTSLFVPERDRLYLAARAGLSTPASIWVVRPES